MITRQCPQCLPIELIHQCYRLLFPASFFENGSISAKPDWKDIEGLTLACKETRQVILSLWFHVLRIADLEDWKIVLRNWQRLYRWTRAIHYSSTVYKTPKYFLEPFLRLNSIRIDLPTTHVTEEGEFDFAAPEIAQILHDGIPSNIIHHLEIRGVTWLDPFVMRHLAEGLPNLRTLKLMQPLVWCGLCNTISAPCFTALPNKIIYDDGTGLPDGYVQYLAPLQHLHTVKLIIACGEGVIPYSLLFSQVGPGETNNQVASELSIPRHSDYSGLIIPSAGPTARRPIGWSGECESCMTQLLEDDAFRESWMRRKEVSQDFTTTTHRGLSYPNRPPSLRRVEWEFLELSNENWLGVLSNFAGYDAAYYI